MRMTGLLDVHEFVDWIFSDSKQARKFKEAFDSRTKDSKRKRFLGALS